MLYSINNYNMHYYLTFSIKNNVCKERNGLSNANSPNICINCSISFPLLIRRQGIRNIISLIWRVTYLYMTLPVFHLPMLALSTWVPKCFASCLYCCCCIREFVNSPMYWHSTLLLIVTDSTPRLGPNIRIWAMQWEGTTNSLVTKHTHIAAFNNWA